MAGNSNLSRRRMLQLTGVGALALAGCSQDGSDTPQEAEDTSTITYPYTVQVYDPTGNVEITQTHAPRLDTIEGKTIALVINDVWESDRIAERLQTLFASRYPSVTVLGPENFIHGSEYLTMDNNGLYEQVSAAGVDAVIIMAAG